MRQQEFMRQLEELLQDISLEEREEALAYYRNYFEDAGVENEEKVLQELESPEKLAESIKAGLQEEVTAEETPKANDFALEAETEKTGNNKDGAQSAFSNNGNVEHNKSDRTLIIVLSVILAVVTCPIWGGFLSGICGVIIGIIGALFGMTVGFLVGGVACMGMGIYQFCMMDVPLGFLALGFGMLLVVLGILALILLVQFCGRFLPWAVRGIVKLIRNIFKKDRKEQNV